jgi:LysR family glycine cleavage system transcriptional activator
MPLTRLPSLSSLRAFEAAARCGSIKEAAAELAVTPGAVSQQIKALEADLRVRLFVRKTRAIHLTPEGQRIQPTISEAFLQIRQVVDQVRPRTTPRLRINSSSAIISKWLLPRLHRFTAAHPTIQVHIESEARLNGLEQNGPDVVIRYTKNPPGDLYHELIHRELILPVANPTWLKSQALNGHEDIARVPILHDTSLTVFGGPSSWEMWGQRAGLATPVDLSKAIFFERQFADQVIDAAVAGSGLAVCRSLLVYSALADGRLTCPFGPVLPSGLSYYVCCRPGREKENHIRAFLSWARKEAAVLSTLNALLEPSVQDCILSEENGEGL